jgi:L-tyrosine isonitrile synthase
LLNSKRLATGNTPASLDALRSYSPAVGPTGAFGRTPDQGGASIHTGRPTKARRLHTTSPEKILQAFNTWSFKREQPDSPALLLEAVSGAVRFGQPVPFVLYWGKGPRCGLGEPDTTCLDYLASMSERVQRVYEPGTSFKLIFTDSHATLNGHTPEKMNAYFGAIGRAAQDRGFETCRLSDLVSTAESAGAIHLTDEAISDEMLERLGACAAKWFRGEGTVEEGAVRYLHMNMIEKRAVQYAFPRSIFVTFNGSEFRSLFPERMPIFYMYSLRRGTSVKPWFLPGRMVDASATGE